MVGSKGIANLKKIYTNIHRHRRAFEHAKLCVDINLSPLTNDSLVLFFVVCVCIRTTPLAIWTNIFKRAAGFTSRHVRINLHTRCVGRHHAQNARTLRIHTKCCVVEYKYSYCRKSTENVILSALSASKH